MLPSKRTSRMLLEAADAAGIDSAPVLASLHLSRDWFSREEAHVPWPTIVRICEGLSHEVGGDIARLRAIGHAMHAVPSNPQLRKIADATISLRALYEIVERWVAPATFSRLRLFMKFGANGRLYIHVYIPASYEGSCAFMQIVIGAMSAVPLALDLPMAEVVDARVDERSMDAELLLPSDRSLWASGARLLTGVLRRAQRRAALEEQRLHLSRELDASQRARDELRTVLEWIPDLVAIHIDGRIAFVNRTAVRALGWSTADELVGRPLIDLVDPRSRALFTSRLAIPAGMAQPELAEAWLTTREGRALLIEVLPAQAISFDGVPARLIVAHDLRERDRLRQRLATADRFASLGLLAAGVAHEVNNPLAYVLNNIEIARKQLDSHGNADVARGALEIALEGVDRIRFVVRELLFLARGEPTPVGPTDLAETVQSTLALARIEIARTAKLVLDIEPVGQIQGSAPRIAQIVLNLVLNALEAMSAGDAIKNELTVRVKPSGDAHALLEISDNGVGVTADVEGKIFDPFFTTKAEGRGTGLGLTITQRLVIELGGEISFTSEPYRGTTFRVLFVVFEVKSDPPQSPA